jgi:hypothetical protein
MTYRSLIFRGGVVTAVADLLLYLVAVTQVRIMILDSKPLGETLHFAAIYFMIGSLLALVASIMLLFGYGWKRVPLILGCLASLPFWYGFTCY